jgi:calcium/calmodulin-dependent protein kinase (CaM kinase) II
MNDATRKELLELNARLLASIAGGDWPTYSELCDASLTAFEPEAQGQLVEGLEFHKFFFDLGASGLPHHTTMASPHVRLLGDDVAVVSYTRLVQRADAAGTPSIGASNETRVWHRQQGRWRHVHFHRSPLA